MLSILDMLLEITRFCKKTITETFSFLYRIHFVKNFIPYLATCGTNCMCTKLALKEYG